MRKETQRWIPFTLFASILTVMMMGCGGSIKMRGNDTDPWNYYDGEIVSGELDALAQAELPDTRDGVLNDPDLLSETEILQRAPIWVARADSEWNEGLETSAEEELLRAVISISGILPELSEDDQNLWIDSLARWARRYSDWFGGPEAALGPEGFSPIIIDDSTGARRDSLFASLGEDSFVVELDTTIGEFGILPDVPDTINVRVAKAIEYFVDTKRGRAAMSKWLSRANDMIPRMQPTLREHGLPEDLIYLSMIESGFVTHARSWAKAVGPWQFIRSTARIFELEADWWYDERRDPKMSTAAAALFLRQLHEHFDDWYLAIAAYNCGEGRVWREVRRSKTRNFWKLTRLPKQTRLYVPTFLAARRIARNPEAYGFEAVKYVEPSPRDSVLITECVDLSSVAGAIAVDLETLRSMNPALIRWCTPPNRDTTILFVPEGKAEGFSEAYAQIPEEKKTSWARHKVRRGETLSIIADNYRTSMRAIMDVPANGLRNPNRIHEGDWLLIPVNPAWGSSFSHVRNLDDAELPSGSRRAIHIVRRGDTLSEIAESYNVGLSRLLAWNRLSRRSVIRPGQRLVVYTRKATGPASRSGAAASTGAAPKSGPPVASSNKLVIPEHTYTIRRGDALLLIASAHSVPLDKLMKMNRLSYRSEIHPGDRLVIPEATIYLEDAFVYKVKPGDSLYRIAERFQVSINNLSTWNSLNNIHRIYPGDRLVVSSGSL